MEKKDYRENLAILSNMFPGKVAISVKEAAQVIGANQNTVYDAIKRKWNPLPAQKLAKKKILIPLAGFARWLSN